MPDMAPISDIKNNAISVSCVDKQRDLGGHLGIRVERLLKPLGVVLEPAVDAVALQQLVVAVVAGSEVGGLRDSPA